MNLKSSGLILLTIDLGKLKISLECKNRINSYPQFIVSVMGQRQDGSIVVMLEIQYKIKGVNIFASISTC